jgi:hypothetical protein
LPERTRESLGCHGAAAAFPHPPSRRRSASGCCAPRWPRSRRRGTRRSRWLTSCAGRKCPARRSTCTSAAGKTASSRRAEGAGSSCPVTSSRPRAWSLTTPPTRTCCAPPAALSWASWRMSLPSPGSSTSTCPRRARSRSSGCGPPAAGSPSSTRDGTGGPVSATRTGPPFPTRRTRPWPAPPPSWSGPGSAPTRPKRCGNWRTPSSTCTSPSWPPARGRPRPHPRTPYVRALPLPSGRCG